MRHLTLVALLSPTAALAHTDAGADGSPLVAGLAHPILGPDHLLAMVAVGLFAAMTGGRARLAYPASFVGAMILGGALGLDGAAVPAVEPTILASIIVLGVGVAAALNPPLPLACATIALFGLAHGNAHGLEGPVLGAIPYAFGFAVATAALHGLGLGLGLAAARDNRAMTRALGGLTCLAGAALTLA